jgi:hypothetical protein
MIFMRQGGHGKVTHQPNIAEQIPNRAVTYGFKDMGWFRASR